MIQSLKVLAMAPTAAKVDSELDFQFLITVISSPYTPEYSGYNTKLAREFGSVQQYPTTCMYTPLIDDLTEETDQQHAITTFAQQL